MGDHSASKGNRSASIDLGDLQGKIERLPHPEKGPEKIRLSCWSKDQKQSLPIDLSEKELVTLLQRAIRAGLLSPDFIHNLHSEFEI